MRAVAVILALALAGCTTLPAKPDLFNRIGDTGKHFATALRVGAGDLIGNFALASVTISATGTVTAKVIDIENRNPAPAATPKP